MAKQTAPLSLKPHITPNSFLSLSEDDITPPFLNIIFFIPGNPGLISYYHHFFSLLVNSISSPVAKDGSASRSQNSLAFYGASLFGFEIGDPSPPGYDYYEELIPHSPTETLTHTLQDQIDLTRSRLHTVVSRIVHSSPRRPRVQVTLIGHSLGAYIAVKLLHRYRTLAATEKYGFEIKSVILLMPPIGDLARSPHARIANPLVANVPYLPSLAQGVVRGLIFFLPEKVFRWLVTYRMGGLASGLADAAVNATIGFLQSRGGVRQAVSLAIEELKEINDADWDKSLWSEYRVVGRNTRLAKTAPSADDHETAKAKVHLYFAKEDGWVDQEAMVEVQKAIAPKTNIIESLLELEMYVEQSVKHDFCVRGRDCATVAEKVAQWIREKDQTSH